MAHLTASDAKQVSDLLIAEAGMPANLTLYFQEYMTTRMKGGRKEFLLDKFGKNGKLHVTSAGVSVCYAPQDATPERELLVSKLNTLLSGIPVMD